MSNNRTLGNLAQLLDSAASGAAISKRNGSIGTIALSDSDVGGVAGTGFTDSNLVKNIIDINHITKVGRTTSSSDGLKAILQGNAPTTLNPSASATYNLGDSSNPIDEIILDSSATIFFGAVSLTSVLKSGTSTIAVAAVAAGPVSGSAETSFLLKTDSTQTDAQVDASTNAFTITEAGNVTSTAFTPYHPKGYSTYFDGTGDYITVPSNSGAPFDFGTDNFTIEGWFYLTTSGSWTSYWGISEGGGSSQKINLYDASGDGTLDIDVNGSVVFSSSAVLTDLQNKWAHIALVREGTGTNQTKLYVNGSVVGQGTVSTNFSGFSQPFTVGHNGELYSNAFNGYISDFRVVNGTAVYTADFTPPTERLTAITGTELLTCHLPYFADGSSNAQTVTVTGNTKTEPFSPYDHVAYSTSSHGGSVYFDGTGDYLTISSSGSTIGGLSAFTVEGWYWPEPSSSGYDAVYSCAGGLSTGYQTAGRLYNYNGDIGLYWNSVDQAWGSGSWNLGTWNHFAVTHDGTTTKVYVNGVQEISTTSPSFSGTTDIIVSEPSYPAHGYISDFKISNSVIYSTAFTPPTEPLTAISGTQLLTCTNKNSIYDAAAGQDVTVTGDAAASTTQYKWSSSTAFDDNGDYLTATVDPPGTGDYTLECWVRFNSMSAGNQSFLSFGTFSPAIYYRSASNELAVYYSSAFYLSGFTPVADTWYHVAWTRSGTSCRLFVDGVQKGTTASNAHNVTSSSLRMGYDGVDYFGGYIEDVRYTKGLARYTADFTPPAAALEG